MALFHCVSGTWAPSGSILCHSTLWLSLSLLIQDDIFYIALGGEKEGTKKEGQSLCDRCFLESYKNCHKTIAHKSYWPDFRVSSHGPR